MNERGRRFWILATVFALFTLFLYGPMIAIVTLSFQGPEGGLTFPMRGFSTHWFAELWKGVGVVDIWAAFGRSLRLGVIVSALTLAICVPAALAYRIGFRGATLLFYTVIASLIMPSIVVSLGIGLEFRLMDDEIRTVITSHETSSGLFTSALGAHLTWTLPFGLLILLAAFNRFDRRYEEAARDLGASPGQTLWLVILPIIAPSLIGIALFGFTLSWDEIARTSQAIGGRNTLPLELRGLTQTVTTPAIYALGTVTTAVSVLAIGTCLGLITLLRRRRVRH
ncbi:ABC transporter permease [Acuticoccus sp. M5D2P5]|uniref:ABC transporter permease n=1 Tax=Acuticoccus kalidii TaxID=2910977 RepID=UPI001F260C8F|nr:ABC transporter permease [Acuticoccus kalidii]MCF3933522.1 ABC transporter permease [Acuticoccus kalidii]